MVLRSVADCHCFDADPDPDSTFRFDADPDPDLNPTQVLPKLKIRFKKTLITSSASLHCFISILSHRCHNFQNFGQYCEIFWKGVRYYLALNLGLKWVPVRIRIRPNDADSPGSGFTNTTVVLRLMFEQYGVFSLPSARAP
jgi:hypothetical protein